MRLTVFATLFLPFLTVLGQTRKDERLCTLRMKTTYELLAPSGWKVTDCFSGVRSQHPNFWLEPESQVLRPPTSSEPFGIAMYGGPAGPGTIDEALASDRKIYGNGHLVAVGESLATADKREVRVIYITSRVGYYSWLAHGYFKVGPSVFWVAFDCRREEYCMMNYQAFKSLVGSLRVVPSNDSNVR